MPDVLNSDCHREILKETGNLNCNSEVVVKGSVLIFLHLLDEIVSSGRQSQPDEIEVNFCICIAFSSDAHIKCSDLRRL